MLSLYKENSCTSCELFNSKYIPVGWGESVSNYSTVSIEWDLRSDYKNNRTIRFMVDGTQQECYFYNVPLRVKVGVCFIIIIAFL